MTLCERTDILRDSASSLILSGTWTLKPKIIAGGKKNRIRILAQKTE